MLLYLKLIIANAVLYSSPCHVVGGKIKQPDGYSLLFFFIPLKRLLALSSTTFRPTWERSSLTRKGCQPLTVQPYLHRTPEPTCYNSVCVMCVFLPYWYLLVTKVLLGKRATRQFGRPSSPNRFIISTGLHLYHMQINGLPD